ncbi:MAG: Asp-tRNA(Asn)/Glu-tRNA(Gln) amidotransferase subunit GatB [Microgenomates group bacterium]|nr:Asp-tRNA(Asn)/Glu-tRNA(Gln) amidotransferase subunit GatB [Candidatus Woesebacteria bacterium]MBP6883372.1 Asp-tRNA(Asn)/Glu-tRNA(Gln) amidotransferase subunit GatB [Candidatus Woesebacteria bacterium]
MTQSYSPVIGLEIHVELSTKSKMFCQCSAEYFGKEPNSNTCPVCLGLPGALPVPNRVALDWCIKIGKALNCTINVSTKFDRKHYSYPDLPKGYQISQYDEPVAINGSLKVGEKTFGITRVHMEEDTGKLLHVGEDSLVDFNRSGVPLVEIVTEPDFTNSDEVKEFLQELHTIIRYLEVSDADMEKGSMRMEPNISLRVVGDQKSDVRELPNYKVEVKNINSFNFVKKAIDYELTRQAEILDQSKTPEQETRGYDEKTMKTVSQRSKEEAHDYRYFPEPDIPPFVFEQKFIDSIALPELPTAKIDRYVKELKIKEIDARILTKDFELVKYFEKVVELSDLEPQKIANLVINSKLATNVSIEEFISQATKLLSTKKTDMPTLMLAIKKVIAENSDVVTNYKAGKLSSLMFLVGQVMREMKGQAEANLIKDKLVEAISNS